MSWLGYITFGTCLNVLGVTLMSFDSRMKDWVVPTTTQQQLTFLNSIFTKLYQISLLQVLHSLDRATVYFLLGQELIDSWSPWIGKFIFQISFKSILPGYVKTIFPSFLIVEEYIEVHATSNSRMWIKFEGFIDRIKQWWTSYQFHGNQSYIQVCK